uniref:Nipped-B protein n=1 Tax=Trichobilharzia regenti TaxID=157069 RepID=A0AA85JDS5_TRIRE|nr:unnamed protein product [Trichobilharzia regenti]
MPGDIGRIPIISLSGCKYLTDIINELPIPKSTNLPIRCHTLLNDQKVAQEAYRCINCKNEALVDALIKGLSSVNNDVQFKDKSIDRAVDPLTSPLLLRAVLDKNSDVFSGQTNRNVPCQPEDPLSSIHLVSSEFSGDGVKSKDKPKLKKSKNEGITYNAVRVAPLKISIKKTSTVKTNKSKKRSKSSKDVPSISDESSSGKTETSFVQIDSKVSSSHDLCDELSKQTLADTISLKKKSPHPGDPQVSEDSPPAFENSPKFPSAASVSLESMLNPVINQVHSELSASSNNSNDGTSKVNTSETVHMSPSPCKTNQLNVEHPTSPKTGDHGSGALGCDTNPVQTRRIPDPALSQIFHSVALFHPYQPTCEPDKGVDSQGGGLFDDWVDTPKLAESPSIPALTIPNKCASSGCFSVTPVSSVSTGVKEMLSVGASNELATGLSRSPQSVLSNCSYPTTPGGNIMASFHSTTSVTSVPALSTASSLSLCKGGYSQVTTPSSTRLFDTVDETLTTNLTTCNALDEQVNSTPHGLAAYLPRCNNQRPTQASVFTNDDVPVTSANSVSPRSALSPSAECTDLSSVSPLEVRTPGSSKMGGSVIGDQVTSCSKPKPNIRGRFSAGKPRGGGRRRRTELEELKRWSVIDHANPGSESKISDLCEVRDSPHNSAVSRDQTSLIASEPTVQPVTSKEDASQLNSLDVCNQYGGFTEALVERVKRRRQQREMKLKCCKVSPYKETLRSSREVSPLSTPSPGQNRIKAMSHPRKHKSASFSRRESRKGNQRTAYKTELEIHEKEVCIDIATSNSNKQIHLTDSDCSSSPASTVLSSGPSHSPYMSSLPPIDSVQPSPPVLSYQKIDSPNNCRSHELSVYDRPSESIVQICDLKSSNLESVPNLSVTLEGNEPTSHLDNQNSDFSDAKRNHAKPQWKDTKWPAGNNYGESVSVQSYRSHSSKECFGQSRDSSPHPPPLLPLSRHSPSLFHKPLSVDVSGDKSQENIEFKIGDNHSPLTCAVYSPSMSLKTSKTCVNSPSGQSFNNLTVDVTSNSHNCSSEPSYNPNRTPNSRHTPMNFNSCRQDDIRSSQVTDCSEHKLSDTSESSSSSVTSSSPRVFSGIDAASGSGHRCRTPSTIAYTHSSAMEDNDEDFPTVNSCRRHDVNADCDSNSDSSEIKSCSGSTEPDALKTDDFRSYSLSSLSSITDEVSNFSSDEHEVENSRLSDFSSSTVLHQFTSRLSKILRRVEELDLLQLAAVVQNKLGATYKKNSDQEDSDNSSTRNNISSMLPDSARLTKQEIISLCSDSAKIRSAGSMSTIPTGRLVRFLTLLLVNMQEATSVSPSISGLIDAHRDAKKRYKHHREQSALGSKSLVKNGYFTEALLWSDSEWMSSLIGLDCARTALNIIVGPDMPRPLLMEDLIEGIVSVVRHQLDCLIHNIIRVTTRAPRSSGFSLSSSFSALGYVGYRVTQIIILLVNLMRLQPNRFTDNLVINLTSLAMAIPSYSLTSGTSITNEWKRFLLSPQTSFNLVSYAGDSESMDASEKALNTLFLVSWPEHLQRGSLALISSLYTEVSVDDEKGSSSSDRRIAKTFRLLSSSYFYEQYYGSKSKTVESDSTRVETPQYLYIHTLSALFLCITQSLIHTPNFSFPASNGSNTSGRKFSSSAVSTPTQSSLVSEAITVDNAQFSKDEKHVLNSYSTAVRHAHYLMSGLFKRVSIKAEYDIRSVLETVTNDLLNVTFHAPVEWPASVVLLSVLSNFLIQQFSQTNSSSTSSNTSSSRSRNVELCNRLLAVDTLAALVVGLKEKAKTYNLDLSSTTSAFQHKNFSKLEEAKDEGVGENKHQACLIGLLSSPIPVVHHWYLSFYDILQITNKSGNSDLAEVCEKLNLGQGMMCFPELCSKYCDFLVVTAHRFHLAAWLHNCSRGASTTTSLDVHTGNIKENSNISVKSKPNTEKVRHQLLAELALTHSYSSVFTPGFSYAKQNLSSISATCTACPHSSQHSFSRGRANCICCSCMGWGGSFLAQSMSSQRFIAYAHAPRLCSNIRIRLAAHAHISAVYILRAHSVLPNFDVLYGFICKLARDTLVPMRSKALRCLASVIDADPKLMCITKDSKDNRGKSSISSNPIFDIPDIVRSRLLDNSTAVREAAVDLISRFLTLRPQFLPEYYSIIVERILDKGVSVRKRVIRCFRDLLLNDWNKFMDSSNSNPNRRSFTLIGNQICTDMCLKLIRRLHDEVNIRKMVLEVFHELWLTPISKSHARFSKVLDRRIISLASVTITLRPNNFDLLGSLVVQNTSTDDSHTTGSQFDAACKQIIGRLIVLIKRRIGSLLVPSSKQTVKQSESAESQKLSQSSSILSDIHGLMACLHLVGYSKPNLVRPHVGFLMDLLHKICLSVPLPLTNTEQTTNQTQPANTQCLYHLINVIEIVLTKIASDLNESDSPPMEEAMFAGVSRTNFFQLQSDLLQFVQRHGRVVVDSALSCLAVLVNQVLKDQTQVMCCFSQFYSLLTDLSLELREALSTKIGTSTRISSKSRPSVLRALYTVGLMCKYFTLDYSFNSNKKLTVSNSNLLDEVVDTLMLFAEYASVRIPVQENLPARGNSSSMNDNNNDTSSLHTKSDMNDPDLCRKAITGLGFLLFRHDQLFCTGSVQLFLTRFLSTVHSSLTNNHLTHGSSFFDIQCIILDNLTHYFLSKERKENADDRRWARRSKFECLKELNDRETGLSSAIAQTYLPIVLKYCVVTPSLNVRSSALSLMSTILRQGLIHPSHILSSLMCLQTDSDPNIRLRATACLTEAEQKNPGFAAMRAVSGIRLSYQLQMVLHPCESSSPVIVRGAKDSKNNSEAKSLSPTNNSTNTVLCMNHALYTMLRTNRQQRRSLIVNLLSMFDGQQDSTVHAGENATSQNRISQLIFIADHLAHFPYVVMDEVYYVADLMEQRISLIGSNILRSLYRSLLPAYQSKHSNPEASEISKHSGDRKLATETDLMDFLDKCEANLPRDYDINTSFVNIDSMKIADSQNSHSSLEKELQYLFKHCQSDGLRGKARSSMIYSGPSCLLLMTIRRFIRQHYGVSYNKSKDYSPSDSPKVWEKPIVLSKQSDPSGQLMTLPCVIYQYACNPGWNDLSKGPPDHILLRHFLMLRRELMLSQDNTLKEEVIDSSSKSVAQTSDIEEDIEDEYQTKVKGEERSSALCDSLTTSKHPTSTSEHCISPPKRYPSSSNDQTHRISNRSQIANVPRKRKIVKRQSSPSSLSSLSASSNEIIGEVEVKKSSIKSKAKHSLDSRLQNLPSNAIPKHADVSRRSNYSTDSESVDMENRKSSQRTDCVRSHQSRLQSSPDSSNKTSFPGQRVHSRFESLDSDANSDDTSLDSSLMKKKKNKDLNTKVKQTNAQNLITSSKKQSISQGHSQNLVKTKNLECREMEVTSQSKSVSHQSYRHATSSKQSTCPTRTLAPLPSAMMNSTSVSRPGKHSFINKPAKHNSKQSEFVSKHDSKNTSQQHPIDSANHCALQEKSSKNKFPSRKITHSMGNRTHIQPSDEQRIVNKKMAECLSSKTRQADASVKLTSHKKIRKAKTLSDSEKSDEQLSETSVSSVSSTSTSLSSSSSSSSTTTSEDSLSTSSSSSPSSSSSSSSIPQPQLKQKKKKLS